MNVSAVIVTRGDVDLAPVLDSLPREWEKVIWNNGVREDMLVYGRYAAIAECEHDVIYVQDDDCILEPDSLGLIAAAYAPGYVTCNMPRRFRETGFYDDHALVGFGAIFDRDLPATAFQRYVNGRTMDGVAPAHWRTLALFSSDLFRRTCDIVFTALTPRILVDLPHTDREFASAPNRMWKTPGHVEERTRMLELARKVRDA